MRKKQWLLIFMAILISLVGGSITCFAETVSSSLPKPQISTLIRDGSGTCKLTWGKKGGVSGYEISYSTDWSFKAGEKTRYIKNAATTTSSFSKSSLSTSKDTYFRIRTYINTNGKKIYSNWSQKVRLVLWKTSWKYAGNSKIHSGSATLYYCPNSNRKKITVAVNAGHGTSGGASKKTLSHPNGTAKVTGGTTSAGSKYSIAISGGTTVGNISEAEANLRIAKKLKTLLLQKGYDVLMIRQDSDEQLDNVARTVIANNIAKCHIAIHFDSTTSNKGAFYIGVPNIASYRNMVPVKNYYTKHNKLGSSLISGLSSAGVKIYKSKHIDLDLTQTSYSTIPSMDIEVGDRATSTSDANLTKIAKGLAKGVTNYFGK